MKHLQNLEGGAIADTMGPGKTAAMFLRGFLFDDATLSAQEEAGVDIFLLLPYISLLGVVLVISAALLACVWALSACMVLKGPEPALGPGASPRHVSSLLILGSLAQADRRGPSGRGYRYMV